MPLLIQLQQPLIAVTDSRRIQTKHECISSSLICQSFDLFCFCLFQCSVQPYFPACLLYPLIQDAQAIKMSERSYCEASDATVAQPIQSLSFGLFLIFSNFNQTRENRVCERANQRRCSSAVWFSHHLSRHWLGRRQHIVPPLVSPRQVFSTTVVQISCPAKLRDVHDERSPTDFCAGQIPIDWWTGTMHTAP